MFKLRNEFLFNICCKCNPSRRLFLNLDLYKSTLSVQGSDQKLKKVASNYHYDALDVYTNTIVMESVNKWKNTANISNINKLSILKSNSIFKFCDDPDHIIMYLQQCLDGYCKVSKSVLTQFMLTMAKHGHINGLVLIERLNDKYDYCIKKSDLQMNFAEAYWTNGNLDKMFDIFDTFYHVETMKVNYVLEPIIFTIIKSHGIASVTMVTKFVNSVVLKHKDYHPMCILWKYLFISEVFNDNQEADKLMQQNSNLIEHIQYLLPSIINDMLKKHRTDCVQRIMSMLLKYKQMELYQWTLISLFEYYYVLGNVRQCKEIMKHSIEVNVPLTHEQQSKLFNMVFKNKQPQQINNDVIKTIFKLMF